MDVNDIEKLVELASEWLYSTDHGTASEHARKLVREYDVERACRTIVTFCEQNTLSNVALQFPDSILHHAPFVCQALKYYADRIHRKSNIERTHEKDRESATELFFYVIGDNSSGGCCVDEKTAKHLDTHVIVHYGNACLSSISSIPVLYVFPQFNFDNFQHPCDVVHDSLVSVKDAPNVDRIVILYDVSLHVHFEREQFRAGNCSTKYSRAAPDIRVDVARPRLSDPHSVQNSHQLKEASTGSIVGPLYYNESPVPRSRTAFLWFAYKTPTSEEWPAVVRNAALTLGTGNDPCALFHFVGLSDDESSSTLEMPLPDAQRFLRRRFVQLQKVKDASVIGLIPGDQSVSDEFNSISRCKKILETAGKSYYTFVIGKPEPQKLANFPEVDAFVLASCPENAIFDASEFLRPIVTPLELHAALLTDGDIFSSPYSLECIDMPPSNSYPDTNDSASKNETNDTEDEASGIVARREDWTVSVSKSSGGAEFLQQRLWTGLKFDQGGLNDDTVVEDLSLEIESGQSGIASRYAREIMNDRDK